MKNHFARHLTVCAVLLTAVLLAVGCSHAVDTPVGATVPDVPVSDDMEILPTTDSAAPVETGTVFLPEPEIDGRQIGVDVALGDYYAGFSEVWRLKNTKDLLEEESLSYINVVPDSRLPAYYDRLDELVFPPALTRGDRLLKLNKRAEFDFDGISSLKALKDKAASLLGFEDYSSKLICYSYYSLRNETTEIWGDPTELTDSTDLDHLRGNSEKKVHLKFYNTAYGLPIVDPWYKQGIWVLCAGNGGDGVWTMECLVSGHYDNYNKLNDFVPADERLIGAMPMLDALEIADSTRTTNRDMKSARLVYICVPECFGDEDYHLCWEITMRYTTYYINCETGEKWFNTNSED